ncbi:hypothetical protein COY32_03700 [candidate division WWE3 bacterium CG_4_10_14_0_2_um_filter_41_14]|uniref:Cell division protein FtsX n=1 Tax=candidate division WWE3 bacterium CG_4_10_14_0_2_um_filter_41_14 TaxID=1975072 RepID=A0A2M7TIH1_UNCKA|nr:MAG: hypothetical protein COY32_03700 [candidate division WWE3 bacterium CG_4_10_14_0_2_um_filter_41_14]
MNIIRNAIQHITRSPLQSISVVSILALTFLIGQLFVTVTVGSGRILSYYENRPQVMIFFKDEVLEDQILQIKAELEKDPTVEQVSYISKEQAVEIYKERSLRLFPDKPELLEFVTADMLPASLGVSATSVDTLYKISDDFQNNQFVESAIFQEDLVKELTRFIDALRIAGAIVIAILLFTAIMLMMVVVSHNIRSFGSEIEVMRLVGAGSWYIRWPFVIDSIIFALISSTIATLGQYLLLPAVKSFSLNFIAAVDIIPNQNEYILYLYGATLVFGVVFTSLISLIATWRKVRI